MYWSCSHYSCDCSLASGDGSGLPARGLLHVSGRHRAGRRQGHEIGGGRRGQWCTLCRERNVRVTKPRQRVGRGVHKCRNKRDQSLLPWTHRGWIEGKKLYNTTNCFVAIPYCLCVQLILLFLLGGGLCLWWSEWRFRHPVSRDYLLPSGHTESRIQRGLWECSAPATRETATNWTLRKQDSAVDPM